MKAAIWLRVSREEQTTENQRIGLEQWAERKGFEVVQTYEAVTSGWKGQALQQLSTVYKDAHQRKYDVLLVWALDRLSRDGVSATMEIVDRLGKAGVQVLSFQEPWTEADGPLRELLLSVVAWVARMESERRSERTKAGLERARSQGKHIGRPKGKQDSRKRHRSAARR